MRRLVTYRGIVPHGLHHHPGALPDPKWLVSEHVVDASPGSPPAKEIVLNFLVPPGEPGSEPKKEPA